MNEQLCCPVHEKSYISYSLVLEGLAKPIATPFHRTLLTQKQQFTLFCAVMKIP